MKFIVTIMLASSPLLKAAVIYKWNAYENGVEMPYVPTQSSSLIRATSSTLRRRAANSTNFMEGPYNTLNWCGAVQITSSLSPFQEVTGEWTVPKLELRSGQENSDHPTLSQWVGIDGFDDRCSTKGLIQGGTQSQIQDDGTQQNVAWIEMLPDRMKQIDLTVNKGDQIEAIVTMTSKTGGTISLINKTTGKNVASQISGGDELCGVTAEWILEDPMKLKDGKYTQMRFPGFNKVLFTNIQATYKHLVGGHGTMTFKDADRVWMINKWGRNICTSTDSGGSMAIFDW